MAPGARLPHTGLVCRAPTVLVGVVKNRYSPPSACDKDSSAVRGAADLEHSAAGNKVLERLDAAALCTHIVALHAYRVS